jgi:hypothetical protein
MRHSPSVPAALNGETKLRRRDLGAVQDALALASQQVGWHESQDIRGYRRLDCQAETGEMRGMDLRQIDGGGQPCCRALAAVDLDKNIFDRHLATSARFAAV